MKLHAGVRTSAHIHIIMIHHSDRLLVRQKRNRTGIVVTLKTVRARAAHLTFGFRKHTHIRANVSPSAFLLWLQNQSIKFKMFCLIEDINLRIGLCEVFELFCRHFRNTAGIVFKTIYSLRLSTIIRHQLYVILRCVICAVVPVTYVIGFHIDNVTGFDRSGVKLSLDPLERLVYLTFCTLQRPSILSTWASSGRVQNMALLWNFGRVFI